MPGGVETSRLHVLLARGMRLYEPVLEVVSVLGNMGHWKFHLHNAWMEVCPRSHRPRRLSEEDTATRTAVLTRICLQTVANMCASEDFTKWVGNVGRHNQFHAGCVQLMLRLDLLAHAKKRALSIPSHNSAADSAALCRVMLWRPRLRHT